MNGPSLTLATAISAPKTPVATVTLAGTDAAPLALDNATVRGEVAVLFSATVPVAALPPTTDAGLAASDARAGAEATDPLVVRSPV